MATLGHGAKLYRNTSGTTFQVIGEVVSLDGPSLSLDTVDATEMKSADNFMEFVAGIPDGGELTFVCHYDPAPAAPNRHYLIRNDLEDRLKKKYRVTFPATVATVTFDCFVSAFSPAIAFGALMSLSVTLKITGKPVWA